MDYLKNLFAGEDDEILEHAYREAKEDLELAIDLVLRARLEPDLQRDKKCQGASMSPAGEPLEPDHIQRESTPEQHIRKRPKAAPTNAEPVPSSSMDWENAPIVISDDEDASMSSDDERPPDPGLVPSILAVSNTEDECLAKALEVFPSISRDYVLRLYKEAENTPDLLELLVLKILDNGGKYPKEMDRKKELKRKREDDSDAAEINYEAEDRELATSSYAMQA
ncbi:MAG: hypothetical protein M1813_004911 [Trichoglossum hirsutum]|nr:MAG: hypothetical protein M1813_004911 [Trichoglossum hirsutum]